MPYSANDYVAVASAENCSSGTGSGHGMQIWSNATAAGGHAGGYWFHAPSGTAITHLSYSGDFSGWNGWVAHWATGTDGSGDVADPCASYGTNCNFGLKYGTGNQSASVNNAAAVGFGIWCHASSCPAYDSNSIFGPAGSANVYSAQVTVNEPNEPGLSEDGDLWSAADQWISGAAHPAGYWTLGYSASDPAGVCALHPLLLNSSGGWARWDFSNDWSPNYAAAAPCGQSTRGYAWAPSLSSLWNGVYYLHVQATNPADAQNNNNYVADQAVALYVDNQPPPPVSGLRATSGAMGPSDWSSSPDFSLQWTGQQDYSGPQSPITTTVVSVAGVSSTEQSASQTATTVTVGSNPGAYAASVWEQDQAGNQGSPQSVALYYDPKAPSAPAFGPDRAEWINASGAAVPETISATPGGPSGVYGYSVGVDAPASTDWHDANVTADGGGNGSFDLATLSDGVHQLCAVAFSGAGIAGPQGCTTVRIDRQPPSTTISSSTPRSQTAWVNHPVAMMARCADQAGLSGCQSISYQLDDGPVHTDAGDVASITVDSSGAHTVRAWSNDSAGNHGEANSEQALIDLTSPVGYFAPQDLRNPQQLVVDAADLGSGVAGGQIQLNVDGSWHGLPTDYDAAGHVSAVAADDQLPRGTWAARAIIWDAVGNQTVINDDANGTAVTHSIPARAQTSLRVGRGAVDVRSCKLRLTRVPVVRVHGRLVANQRFAARLRRVCRLRPVPAHDALVRLPQPRGLLVHGQLLSTSGEPVADQRVRVTFTAQGWTERFLGTTATDSRGRFAFELPPGASGTVTFRFAGTKTLGAAQTRLTTQVRGEVLATVAAHLVHRGAQSILRVSGRLVGGYVPQGGVQIQPEYIELGQPTLAWAPFGSPIYTDHHGRWSRNIAIAAAAQGHTYELRFVVNRQAGWPFGATVSRVFTRRL